MLASSLGSTHPRSYSPSPQRGLQYRWTRASPAPTAAPSYRSVRTCPSLTLSWTLPILVPPKSRRLSEPIAVSPEARIPRDHVYHHLEARLDLRFVRDWVSDFSAEGGRPDIDSVIMFKLQLVMLFAGIRSERKLIEMGSLSLAPGGTSTTASMKPWLISPV